MNRDQKIFLVLVVFLVGLMTYGLVYPHRSRMKRTGFISNISLASSNVSQQGPQGVNDSRLLELLTEIKSLLSRPCSRVFCGRLRGRESRPVATLFYRGGSNNELLTLGLDFEYNPDHVKPVGVYRGAALVEWAYFGWNEFEPGRVRVGAVAGSAAGLTGAGIFELMTIHFESTIPEGAYAEIRFFKFYDELEDHPEYVYRIRPDMLKSEGGD